MLLGFKARFEKPILAKRKRHTIRDKRKRPIRVGDRLDCYVNPRQKSMRLLGRWPCVKVESIQIRHRWRSRGCIPGYAEIGVRVDGIELSRSERERLARADGFSGFAEMVHFWRGRLPFHGDIIHWDPDRPVDWTARSKRPPRSRKHPLKPTRPAKFNKNKQSAL